MRIEVSCPWILGIEILTLALEAESELVERLCGHWETVNFDTLKFLWE
jgi:hypothetical protein